MLLAGCAAGARAPAPTGELTLAALAGEWIGKEYLDEVRRSRRAIAPQEEWPALSFAVERSPSGGYELRRTNFHEEIRQPIERLEPTQSGAYRLVIPEPGAADSLTLRSDGVSADGERVVTVTNLWPGTPDLDYDFVRLAAPLPAVINRAVLAGEYEDAAGRRYEFSDAGRATWPDGGFDYTISLDPSEACCEYFRHPDPKGVGGEMRYGYAWQAGRLEIFRVVYPEDGCPISCAPEPLLILSPVS